jgi:hypothetical protein
MAAVAHSDRAHATLSPSKAEMWFNCTASIPLIKLLNPPDTRTAAGDEGTAAHELLEASIKAQKAPTDKRWLGKTFNKVWKVTREMAEAVQVCYDLALELELDGWKIYSEQKNAIQCTREGGTVDIAATKKIGKLWKIKIIDYKHGRGVPVPAKENKQMRLYALGMIDKLYIRKELSEIELIIVQPRFSREPDRWMDTPENLFAFEATVTSKREKINDFLSSKAFKKITDPAKLIEAAEGLVEFVPTEKGCMWCPLRRNCSALAASVIQSAGLDFKDVSSKQFTKKDAVIKAEKQKTFLNPDDVNKLALNLIFFKQWLSSFENHIYEMAAKGKLTDFKVVQGDSNRKWKDEEKVIAQLKKIGFEEDDFMPRSLKGLGVISELFSDKKKREEFLKKNTIRPEGKPCLVFKNDPRPAINPAADFDCIPNPTKE